MAETTFNKPSDPDGFDPDSFENQEERGVELYDASKSAVATIGQTSFTGRLKPAYISVAHGVGGLSEAGYAKGALVIDKQVEVYSPPRPAKPGKEPEKSEPAKAIILSIQDFWKQEVPFGAGVLPEIYANEAEAIKAGRRTVYPKWGSGDPMPDARPALTIRMLVQEPEGVNDRGHFLIEFDGKWWAPCTMIADKTAYGEVIDPLTRASDFTHKDTGIHSALWSLETRSKMAKKTGNFTFVPVFKVIGTLSPDQVKELLAKTGK
jgi:hypothetical protein